MPILFVGPSGVIEVSLTPIGQVDRIEKKAQELADECQVRVNVYHSNCGDELERASHLGIACEPAAGDIADDSSK